MPSLVSTAWLAEQLGSADLQLFDASWYMAADGVDARARHREARLPGARFFDIDSIVDPDSTLPHMVPSTAHFERLVGALGVRTDARVVFYDQKGVYSAPRAWWLMRLFGHERTAVLDGGLARWRAEGRALEEGEAPAWPPVPYQARLCARLLRGLGDLLDNLSSGAELVLDARSSARFHAQVPEPRPGLRGGHIPGSRNLPFTEVLSVDQTLKPAAQLRELFAGLGIDEHSRVVTTCGSGMTAAILTLALTAAGLPSGALYDGSWSEWGARADTPIER